MNGAAQTTLYSLRVTTLSGATRIERPLRSLYIVRAMAAKALAADPSAAVSIAIVARRFVVKRATEVIGAKSGLSLAKAREIVGHIARKHPGELVTIARHVAPPANDCNLEQALRASLR